MDYRTMTIDKLSNWIFKKSNYEVNYQDVKSRIENMCIKYKNGDFKISYDIDNVTKRFWHFDCWDIHGNLQTITIEALNEENATIIFKAKHENLGFDPPY